jgi:hypothetical protein
LREALLTVKYVAGGCVGGFNLRDRAVHVYTEAKRVPAFKKICDGDDSPQHKIQELARIMNDSQDSCRSAAGPQLSSCPAVDADHTQKKPLLSLVLLAVSLESHLCFRQLEPGTEG